MVLNTEWAQVEIIDLINDGSGLAFGIIGGRSTGVVVKTIVPGGVADRDGRLQSGDHILQIGEVNLRGLGSEQVASVLRQCGVHVRMVVARPIESTSSDYKGLTSRAAIVPTKILGDQLELDKHLADNGYNDSISNYSGRDSAPYIYTGQSDIHSISSIVEVVRNPIPIAKTIPVMPSFQSTIPPPKGGGQRHASSAAEPLPLDMALREPNLPETETYTVQLRKDDLGLGITVAGYVCEKEEISGIFIKSISRGSAADVIKKLKINDRILKVDDQSVVGLTNHQAVEMLRNAGETVILLLERYLRGPKYDQLQQAIKANELSGSATPSPSLSSLPKIPLSLVKLSSLGIEPETDSRTSLDFDSAILLESTNPQGDKNKIIIDTLVGRKSVQFSICSHESIYDKWKNVIMGDAELIIAEMSKSPLSGLGISLEGTVDVEDGREVRPHHYIRNILPNGPVGKNNILQSGDELLEVNSIQLFGLNHVEVVSILKQLPCLVLLVCVRSANPIRIIDTSQDRDAFRARNILAGSIITLIPNSDKMVKAKSDTSIVSSVTSECCSLDSRSKSLEIINGLPMWSDEETVVELMKTDHGLGFSILDYQDPLDPRGTVIVVRSLIPGSVAQADGRLVPGDRLLSVNGVSVDGAPLDRAVQMLKAAPHGPVRIGVAKPIAATATNVAQQPVYQRSPDEGDDANDASKYSQDTDIDDQACLEDFQECIEEYQECLDAMHLCIDDDESALSQFDIINNQVDTKKIIKEISSPDNKIKIVECNYANKQAETKNNQHRLPQLIEIEATNKSYKTFDCPQIVKYVEEISERDSFETCHDDSLSDEVTKSFDQCEDLEKTPTNSTNNLSEPKNGFLHAGQVGPVQHTNNNGKSVELSATINEVNKNITKLVTDCKSNLKMEFNEYKILDDVEDKIYGESADDKTAILNISTFKKDLFENIFTDVNHQLSESIIDSINILPVIEEVFVEINEPEASKASFDEDDIDLNRNEVEITYSNNGTPSESISIVTCIIDNILSTIDDINVASHSDDQISHSKKLFLESMLEEDNTLQEEIMISCSTTFEAIDVVPAECGLAATVRSPETPDILEAIAEEAQADTVQSVQDSPLHEGHLHSARYNSTAFSEPCLKPIDSFQALDFFADIKDDELKSYDNQADSLGGDQFFLVQYPQEDVANFHKEVSKCLSEPVVILDAHHPLGLDSQHLSFTYRINEYYNDIDECLESFHDEGSTQLATSSVALEVGSGTVFKVTVEDDELDDVDDTALLLGLEHACDVALGRCRSEPNIRDKTFLMLTYDPGPVGEQEQRRNSAFVEGRYENYDGVTASNNTMALVQPVDNEPTSNSGMQGNDETNDSHIYDKRWGPIKTVQIHREPNKSLGISIVGGKVDLCANELAKETVLGIFIKKVVDNSPAGETGQLKTGDRILEVSGVDIRHVNHEKAVEIIRYATNPITFIVQSIIPLNNEEFVNTELLPNTLHPNKPTLSDIVTNEEFITAAISPITLHSDKSALSEKITSPTSPEERKDRLSSNKSVEFSGKLIASEHVIQIVPIPVETSEDSDEEDDNREMGGRTRSAKGQGIDRASAANVKLTKEEAAEDAEREDEFGYTSNKVKKKYANLGHSIQMVQLERSGQGLGLSLAGHKDRNCMAVFVCGVNPAGAAHRTGGIQVGDEILEVNGVVLHGRCHLNASAIIKGLSGPIFKIIILRRKAAIDDIAVRPITQFPTSLAEEASEDSFSHYPNVRNISIKKGNQSLGIMIIEGKHADVGQGIFISDIQEGSSAEKAGLEIGEMILAVNKDSLLGSNYDTAANLLKRTEGLVNLVVSNPGKRPVSPTTDTANKNTNNKPGLKTIAQPSRPTTPVPEPPVDHSTCSLHPGKDTTIEITTDNQVLGLFFIGGKDTQLQGSIVIVEIFSKGAASKDKRLQAGDQILEVNGISLKDVTHSTASQALRQTLPKMKLVVHRPEKLDYQTVDSEFVKKPGKGLGLSVMTRKSGKGVYISEIMNGGCADVEGKIMKGDIITCINGHNIDNSSAEEAGILLKTVTGKNTYQAIATAKRTELHLIMPSGSGAFESYSILELPRSRQLFKIICYIAKVHAAHARHLSK